MCLHVPSGYSLSIGEVNSVFDCCKQSLKWLLHPPRTKIFANLTLTFFFNLYTHVQFFPPFLINFIIQLLCKCSIFPAFFISLNIKSILKIILPPTSFQLTCRSLERQSVMETTMQCRHPAVKYSCLGYSCSREQHVFVVTD